MLIPAQASASTGPLPLAEIDPTPRPTWGAEGVLGAISLDIDSEIFAIEQIGRTLFVGGRFARAIERRNGRTVDQPYLMALDAETGQILDWFRPRLNGAVMSLQASADGSRLFVGGEFYSVDDHAGTAGLVALDPRSGQVDPSWTTNVERLYAPAPPSVRNLVIADGDLYAVGSFNAVTDGSGSRRGGFGNVMRFDLATGLVDSTWRPQLRNGSGWGIAVDVGRNRAYVTGTFSSANGDAGQGNFATLRLSDGANEPNAPSYPFNHCCWRETFDVVAVGDLVFVGGSQHALGVIDADSTGATYDLVNRVLTNSGGGDIQDIELVGDRIYASCHCYDRVWDNDVGSPSDRVFRGEVHGIFAVNARTGAFADGFPNESIRMTLSAGPWAIHGGADGCLWVGGDVNPVSGASHPISLARFCDASGSSPSGLPTPAPRSADTTPPTRPGRPTATLTGTNVRLTWSASSDGRGVASYVVLRDGRTIAKAKGRSITLLEQPGGTHAYSIVAEDPAGNESAPSPPTDVVVPGTPGRFRSFVRTNLDSWLAGAESGPFRFARDIENGSLTRDGVARPLPASRLFGRHSPGGMPVDDGGLAVRIGGDIEPSATAFDQAAGYRVTVSVDRTTPLSIEFDYRLAAARNLGEARAVVWLDGRPVAPGGPYLTTADDGVDTGWRRAEFDLGTVSAGAHDITIGMWVDWQARRITERFSTLWFDDVTIADARPGVAFVGVPNRLVGSQAIRVAAQDLLTVTASLTAELSLDGGSTWQPMTYGSGEFSRRIDTARQPDGQLPLVARITDGDGRRSTARITPEVDNARSVGELAAAEGAAAVWRLDEVAGAADDLVADADGRFVGNPILGVPSPVVGSGRAVRFDGNGDGLVVDSTPSVDRRLASQSTVELWFQADTVSGRRMLYEHGGPNRGVSMSIENGVLSVGAWNVTADAGLDAPWVSGPAFVSGSVRANQLHHVALVQDATEGRLTAYLDGTPMGSVDGVGRIFPDTGGVAIGHSSGGSRVPSGAVDGGWFFDGLIDEVAVHHGALRAQDVARHFEAGR